MFALYYYIKRQIFKWELFDAVSTPKAIPRNSTEIQVSQQERAPMLIVID